MLLLQRGFSTGSILTVDADDAARLGAAWHRRYIYNQAACGHCHGTVATWDMAGRRVYCCATCQPLALGDGRRLSSARRAALAAAVSRDPFVSHCAPDGEEVGAPSARVATAALRAALRGLGMDAGGSRAEVLARMPGGAGGDGVRTGMWLAGVDWCAWVE